MTNKNRHGVNQHDENQKEEIKKQFRRENRYEFSITAAALAIIIVFFLISLFNTSLLFSLILSILSLLITCCFEVIEWIKFKTNASYHQNSKHLKYLLRYYSLGFIIACAITTIVMFFFWICQRINSHFFVSLYSQIPNIITTISLIGYFISYSIRNYLQKKEEFLR